MTSNYQFQGVTASSQQKNTPTVPMSVYRELAGELQTTKQQLDGLKQENQELNQQNKSLRLEISKLVQSVQKLETMLNYWDEKSHRSHEESNQPPAENKYQSYLPQSHQDYWLNYQEESATLRPEKSAKSQEVNGWLVAFAIVMIVFTFAGIGFMVARPLLDNE